MTHAEGLESFTIGAGNSTEIFRAVGFLRSWRGRSGIYAARCADLQRHSRRVLDRPRKFSVRLGFESAAREFRSYSFQLKILYGKSEVVHVSSAHLGGPVGARSRACGAIERLGQRADVNGVRRIPAFHRALLAIVINDLHAKQVYVKVAHLSVVGNLIIDVVVSYGFKD